ncbi:MAG: CopG family transcriptional regulator [Gemmataceae bacterium]
MKWTNIYLDEEQSASLDRLARQEGVSRAEVIRRLLDRALAGDDTSRAEDLTALEDSFGSARDTVAPSRGQSDREKHLAEVWRRGL